MPTNAVVGGFAGLGFVLVADDDAPPVVVPSGNGQSVVDGNSGQRALLIGVSSSAPRAEL